MNRVILSLVFALLLSACGSAPAPRSATDEAAIQWDRRGQEAYRRGEYQEALAAYEEALRRYASVEHAEGTGIELLNVAMVESRLGNRERALQVLDQVLASRDAAMPARFKAEAAYRRAHMDIEAGNAVGASSWLERAQGFCGDASCEVAGRLQNMQARLALLRGDITGAEAAARRGLDINHRRGDALEEANSLRLLADGASRRAQYPQALTFYEQALALDKSAAEPTKITLDLLGASRSLAAQGKTDAAVEYAERARRVADSVNDDRGREQAQALLKSLGR